MSATESAARCLMNRYDENDRNTGGRGAGSVQKETRRARAKTGVSEGGQVSGAGEVLD